MKMLVAGAGNIFLSDDAFGVEVVQRMLGTPLPDGVELIDSGIRGVHLAYKLLDGYDVLVLVDAAPRGLAPGTVSLIEVDTSQIETSAGAVSEGQSALVDAHGLEPGAILRMLGSLGGHVATVFVVACEPATVEDGIGLSQVVQDAVPAAIELVGQLITRWSSETPKGDSAESPQHSRSVEEVSR
jgi:hydrogenase maturation protease